LAQTGSRASRLLSASRLDFARYSLPSGPVTRNSLARRRPVMSTRLLLCANIRIRVSTVHSEWVKPIPDAVLFARFTHEGPESHRDQDKQQNHEQPQRPNDPQ